MKAGYEFSIENPTEAAPELDKDLVTKLFDGRTIIEDISIELKEGLKGVKNRRHEIRFPGILMNSGSLERKNSVRISCPRE